MHETKKEKTTTQNTTASLHVFFLVVWGGDLKANIDKKKHHRGQKNHVKCVVSARGYADACGVMVIVHDTTKSSALNAV